MLHVQSSLHDRLSDGLGRGYPHAVADVREFPIRLHADALRAESVPSPTRHRAPEHHRLTTPTQLAQQLAIYHRTGGDVIHGASQRAPSDVFRSGVHSQTVLDAAVFLCDTVIDGRLRHDLEQITALSCRLLSRDNGGARAVGPGQRLGRPHTVTERVADEQRDRPALGILEDAGSRENCLHVRQVTPSTRVDGQRKVIPVPHSCCHGLLAYDPGVARHDVAPLLVELLRREGLVLSQFGQLGVHLREILLRVDDLARVVGRRRVALQPRCAAPDVSQLLRDDRELIRVLGGDLGHELRHTVFTEVVVLPPHVFG